MKLRKPYQDVKELVLALLNDIDEFDKLNATNKNYEGIIGEKSANLLKKIYPDLFEKCQIK